MREPLSTQLNSTENYGRIIIIYYHKLTILLYATSDRFPVPVRLAVKSNVTDWGCQNLSKRALNALTVQASTIELGKLFQIFTRI